MKKILFINKNQDIRQEASDILQEEGYESVFTDNCRLALDLIKDNRGHFVMVILDINELVDWGIEIYDQIKDIDANLPVVTTSTSGHYRPRLGSDRKLVNYGSGQVLYD
ncbi:MAG: response regulator [Firmicutes bacterium]|nr:response regulator [Bacillota bacterium]